MKRNTAPNIDAYISMYPLKTQKILQKVRAVIQKIMPEAEEAMRYGLPTFRTRENLLHFGAYENHLGFYPTPPVIESFKREIAKFRCSKGAVQFPLDQPIPYDLIKEMAKFRRAMVAKSPKNKAKSKTVRRR